MSIKKRNYYMGGKKHTVELKYDGYMYTVISDGVLFKQTPNELFAVQHTCKPACCCRAEG